MEENIEKFIKYLFTTYPKLSTIIKTFEECSKYGEGKEKAYLVSDKTYTINFDKLTPWVYGTNGAPCKSADSLSFSGGFVYLIEFKSGDPTTHPNKIKKLIDGVSGKINDSDKTLLTLYSRSGLCDNERLPQRFFLVADSKKMEIEPALKTLVGLSLKDNKNQKQVELLDNIMPSLIGNIANPEHFDKVDVWYSEIFGTYLNAYNIRDIVCPA